MPTLPPRGSLTLWRCVPAPRRPPASIRPPHPSRCLPQATRPPAPSHAKHHATRARRHANAAGAHSLRARSPTQERATLTYHSRDRPEGLRYCSPELSNPENHLESGDDLRMVSPSSLVPHTTLCPSRASPFVRSANAVKVCDHFSGIPSRPGIRLSYHSPSRYSLVTTPMCPSRQRPAAGLSCILSRPSRGELIGDSCWKRSGALPMKTSGPVREGRRACSCLWFFLEEGGAHGGEGHHAGSRHCRIESGAVRRGRRACIYGSSE